MQFLIKSKLRLDLINVSKLASKLPEPRIKFEKYLRRTYTSIPNEHVFIDKIEKTFSSLKLNKNAWYCDIGFDVVETCICESYNPLQYIFNISLKRSNPIFKAGEKEDLRNYKSVSMLVHISKIFEGIMYNGLYDHLKDKKIIYSKYLAFQK